MHDRQDLDPQAMAEELHRRWRREAFEDLAAAFCHGLTPDDAEPASDGPAE